MTAHAVILGPCSCVPELRLRRQVKDCRFIRRCRLSRASANMGDDRVERIQLGPALGIVAGMGRDGNLESDLVARVCRVAVVGAGAAGLVAARELAREGHEVVVYEQNGLVGGVWVYDPRVEDELLGTKSNITRVQNSMYESLRTNLPRELMGFLDFPFRPMKGRDPRRYPGHEEVRLYLQDFAEKFGVMRLVRFNTQVVDVSPVVKDVDRGAETGCHDILCQKMWDSAERRDGSVLGDARDLARPLYEGPLVNGVQDLDFGQVRPQVPAQWVVKSRRMVGEVADDAAQELFDAVVVCNGHYSEPKIASIPGIESWPGTAMHSHNYRVPGPFRDQVVVLVGAAASGEDISREVATVAKEVYLSARDWSSSLDLSKPDSGQGNLWRRPLIESVSADGAVRFKDGSTVFADTIMFCTGYVYSFPFLNSHGCVSVEENQVGPLYQHVFPPALAPSLSFVGLPYKVVPFPLCELQSKWIAKVLSGRLCLPSARHMMAAVLDFYASLKKHGLPKRYTHNADAYQFAYVSWLAEQCGCEVDWWREEMYAANRNSKRAHPVTYRDQWNDHQLMRAAYSSLTLPQEPTQSVPT